MESRKASPAYLWFVAAQTAAAIASATALVLLARRPSAVQNSAITRAPVGAEAPSSAPSDAIAGAVKATEASAENPPEQASDPSRPLQPVTSPQTGLATEKVDGVELAGKRRTTRKAFVVVFVGVVALFAILGLDSSGNAALNLVGIALTIIGLVVLLYPKFRSGDVDSSEPGDSVTVVGAALVIGALVAKWLPELFDWFLTLLPQA